MTDEITETAKAAQEVAKATGKAIDATQKLGCFVAKTISEPLEITIGILTDRLRYVRWERQIRLADRCNELMLSRGLEGKARIVAPKIALPIIQNASLEENDYLQDLWVNLLVTAMDPNQEIPRSAYIDIIKQLEPIDVKILEFIYSKYTEQKNNSHYDLNAENINISRLEIQKFCGIDDAIYRTSADNLIRMRLIATYVEDSTVETEQGESCVSYDVSIYHGYRRVCITCLGVSFVRACTKIY